MRLGLWVAAGMVVVAAGATASTVVTSKRCDVEGVTRDPCHVLLGFDTTVPLAFNKSGKKDVAGVTVAKYGLTFSGTAQFAFAFGADVSATYDRAELAPGGTLHLGLTYLPTNDPGREIHIRLNGTVDADACGVGICKHVHLVLSPLLQANADFAAPLAGDGPISAPLTGDSVDIADDIETLVTFTPKGTLRILPANPPVSPDPVQKLIDPVFGYAGAVVCNPTVPGSCANASLANPLDAPTEWTTAGETIPRPLLLGSASGAIVGVTVSPLLHWVTLEATLEIDVKLKGILSPIDDPDPIPLIPGLVANDFPALLASIGAADTISQSVPPPYGARVKDRIDAGVIPAPFLSPETPSLGGSLTLGSLTFRIPTDADGDGIPDGPEIHDGTNPDEPDTDHDGYDDGVETPLGCNPRDGFEIPLQPERFQGSQGGPTSPVNRFLTYAIPTQARVDPVTDPSCVTGGRCVGHFCATGRVGDRCSADADCVQPAGTCRVIVNVAKEVPDLVRGRMTLNRTALDGFDPLTPGCSRKVDVALDRGRKINRLRLEGIGTAGGRVHHDFDTFTYR